MTGLHLVVRWGKAFAAFCASALEHELACLCSHPHSKTVSLRAAPVVRLKGPLHVTTLRYRKD